MKKIWCNSLRISWENIEIQIRVYLAQHFKKISRNLFFIFSTYLQWTIKYFFLARIHLYFSYFNSETRRLHRNKYFQDQIRGSRPLSICTWSLQFSKLRHKYKLEHFYFYIHTSNFKFSDTLNINLWLIGSC